MAAGFNGDSATRRVRDGMSALPSASLLVGKLRRETVTFRLGVSNGTGFGALWVSWPFVLDNSWTAIAPLLPPEAPNSTGGRPPISNRAALSDILSVLRSGLPW